MGAPSFCGQGVCQLPAPRPCIYRPHGPHPHPHPHPHLAALPRCQVSMPRCWCRCLKTRPAGRCTWCSTSAAADSTPTAVRRDGRALCACWARLCMSGFEAAMLPRLQCSAARGSQGARRGALPRPPAQLLPAGEVCCPGGKRDVGDADDIATALREAQVGREPGPDSGALRQAAVCLAQPSVSFRCLPCTPASLSSLYLWLVSCLWALLARRRSWESTRWPSRWWAACLPSCPSTCCR